MDCLLSIVIPVYNAEKYLEQCLNSLNLRNNPILQVILINDGSEDYSGVICEKYKRKYPDQIIYLEKKNEGVSAARNQGIEWATGKYIAFWDADDFISLNAVDIILESLNSENELYIYNYYRYENEKVIYCNHTLKSGSISAKKLVENNIFEAITYQVWDKIFLTKIIKEHDLRFDCTMCRSEDADFWVRYFHYVSYVQMSQGCFYYYRINPSGAVATPTLEAISDNSKLFKHQKELLDSYDVKNKEYKYLMKVLVEHISNEVDSYIRAGFEASLVRKLLERYIVSKLSILPIGTTAKIKFVLLKIKAVHLIRIYFDIIRHIRK